MLGKVIGAHTALKIWLEAQSRHYLRKLFLGFARLHRLAGLFSVF